VSQSKKLKAWGLSVTLKETFVLGFEDIIVNVQNMIFAFH
jgi:hypothetical protein